MIYADDDPSEGISLENKLSFDEINFSSLIIEDSKI